MKIQLPSNLTGVIQSADYRKLDDGKIWFGEVDKDPRSYPIDTFLDKAMTIPAPPYFWLKMGYVSHNGQVVDVYVADDVERVSILITDVYGRQLMYLPSQSVAVVCDTNITPPKDGNSTDDNDQDKDKDKDNGCACEWGAMGILPPVVVQIVPADQPQPTDQPPDDDNGETGGDIEILPPPPPTDEFAGFTHTEQRVGFFSTRKFREDDWVDYLKNGTVPTRYNRYDYSIYTDPFILKLTFNEIVNETVKYLSTLLDEGLQKRKYQNPNIEFADTAPYIIIELQESQPIAYAQDDFNGLINKDLNWGNFKAIKPLSNNFTNEIDFDVRQSDYYNSNTEKMWNDYVINNFHPLTIRNRETIGVVGKKVEFGKNAPAEYFKLSNEIPTDGFHTFSVKLFKKCLYSYNGLPAGNVTVSAPIYLNMISLIAKRNSEQYFDIFPKNLIENGVNYV